MWRSDCGYVLAPYHFRFLDEPLMLLTILWCQEQELLRQPCAVGPAPGLHVTNGTGMNSDNTANVGLSRTGMTRHTSTSIYCR